MYNSISQTVRWPREFIESLTNFYTDDVVENVSCCGTYNIHVCRPAYVIITVADALVPNRRHAISNHHAESTGWIILHDIDYSPETLQHVWQSLLTYWTYFHMKKSIVSILCDYCNHPTSVQDLLENAGCSSLMLLLRVITTLGRLNNCISNIRISEIDMQTCVAVLFITNGLSIYGYCFMENDSLYTCIGDWLLCRFHRNNGDSGTYTN